MRYVIAALLCLLVPATVAAKPSQVPMDAFSGDRYVTAVRVAEPKVRYLYRTKQRHPYAHPAPRRRAPIAPGVVAGGQVIGGRPSGCPSRFCGCGASLHVFGRIIPTLNLAANWLRFPRTSPASGMVAARRGHVFVLKWHIAGNMWIVYDANSGGGRSRIHPRSIAGFVIVNPRG